MTANQIALFATKAEVDSQAEEVKQATKRTRIDSILSEMKHLHEELNAAISYKTNPYRIHNPTDIANLVMYEMSALEHEEMRVILLDTRNQVMSIVSLYKGTLNSANVRISEVFRQAIIDNAAAIVVIHNHPSGDPTPSPDDVRLTRSIVEIGKVMDIEVLDHMIVAGGQFISLKERGAGF